MPLLEVSDLSSSDCSPEWRQLVSCQADGEVDDFDTVRLNRHLADCPACMAWAAEVSSLAGLMRSPQSLERELALTPQVLLRRWSRASFATASAASVVAAAVAAFALQLPMVVGLAGSGHGTTRGAAATSCDWCVAHRAFLRPAFVEVGPTSLPPIRVLLNPAASA
jgi:predicted anti-sigma-YlaC factor YlaD